MRSTKAIILTVFIGTVLAFSTIFAFVSTAEPPKPGATVEETPAPRFLRVYERSWPDQEGRDFYTAHGFRPYPQLTAFRLATPNPHHHFDQAKFDSNIYSPERYLSEMQEQGNDCDGIAAHMSGIPPDWGLLNRSCQVDLEKPWWNSFRTVTDLAFDEIQATIDVKVYIDSAKAIRARFPGIEVLLYNPLAIRHDTTTHTKSLAAQWSICMFYDGACPAMYVKSDWDVAKINQVNAHWLRSALAYKKGHGDFLIIAEVWKLYRNAPRDVIPLDIARAQIEFILDYEYEGMQVDGLMIFDTMKHPEATLPYARMIAEEIAERADP